MRGWCPRPLDERGSSVGTRRIGDDAAAIKRHPLAVAALQDKAGTLGRFEGAINSKARSIARHGFDRLDVGNAPARFDVDDGNAGACGTVMVNGETVSR